MTKRLSLLIAIERYELAFWTGASRVLGAWRERSLRARPRVDEDLEAALRWASDAERARREEIAFLSSRRGGRVEAPRVVPNDRGLQRAA